MISHPRVLQQNANFAVVEKPPLWLSVPGRFKEDDRPIVGTTLQDELGLRIWPVHRLDFEVSGIMLFALNAEAHREAGQLFEKHLVRKIYQAISEPVTVEFSGRQTWQRKLLRGKKRSYESPHGELAITEAELVSADGEWSLSPRTGKSHQLRVEMASHGYPIAGDLLYGSKQNWRHRGIALRAISLEFPAEFAKKFELETILTVPKFA